jgi:hypothetical protein
MTEEKREEEMRQTGLLECSCCKRLLPEKEFPKPIEPLHDERPRWCFACGYENLSGSIISGFGKTLKCSYKVTQQ